MFIEYCEALHVTPNEILGYTDTDKEILELKSLFGNMDKDEYDRAIRVIKALK